MPQQDTESVQPAKPEPPIAPYVTPHDDTSSLLPMLIAGLVMITVGYTVIMLFV